MSLFKKALTEAQQKAGIQQIESEQIKQFICVTYKIPSNAIVVTIVKGVVKIQSNSTVRSLLLLHKEEIQTLLKQKSGYSITV